MTLPSLPRRTVVTTAAWATPAVLAATAAPAFASSGATTLSVGDGNTQIAPIFGGYLGPVFDGFTIQPNKALNSGALTVTLAASSPTTSAYLFHHPGPNTDNAAPWVTVDRENTFLSSLTYTYPAPVAAGVAVPLAGGLAIVITGGYSVVTDFTVTITITAPGATPVVRTFSTPVAAPQTATRPSDDGTRLLRPTD